MSETFSFGKNWQKFLAHCLAEERMAEAASSLKNFLNMPDLAGKVFMDAGAGSGLFSYAAHQLGAAHVVSFDVDSFSVQCCRHLHKLSGSPESWIVLEGSVLDDTLLKRLKPADIVYSWGVLHHTGDMWTAIRNTASLVKSGGLFYIALYNKTSMSRFWAWEKRFFNRSPRPVKWIIEGAFMALSVGKKVVTLKNPVREIRDYQKGRRGMSWHTDITDWLGGYPYECATADEVFEFCKRELGMKLENLRTTNGRGINEFLFRKPSAQLDHP